MKRTLPLVITFLSALVMVVQYYVPRIDFLGDLFSSFFQITSAFALILGLLSLLMVNGGRVWRRAPNWGYNLVLVVAFFVTLGLGVTGGVGDGTPFNWIFRHVFTPLSTTIYSLLAFFIASAAFRAFKAKTVEATLMLATAFIVMLGRVPVGEYLWTQFNLGQVVGLNHLIDDWIMGGFNTAGQRAILLGASIGLISVSLKIMLGIERSYLGGE